MTTANDFVEKPIKDLGPGDHCWFEYSMVCPGIEYRIVDRTDYNKVFGTHFENVCVLVYDVKEKRILSIKESVKVKVNRKLVRLGQLRVGTDFEYNGLVYYTDMPNA